MRMIKLIKRILPPNLKEKMLEWYWLIKNKSVGISYSQQGEDILLLKSNFFPNNKKGFYIDIGAHHPKILSNTYLFYKMGWHGINIDPIPGMIEKFKCRKRDTNLNIGISNNESDINYFIFKSAPLNTTDKNRVEELNRENIFPEKQIEIKTQKLSKVLKEYVKNEEIDFLSINVEGCELDVLKSNDWNVFKPKIIIVEITNLDMDKLENNEIHTYLSKLGYKLFARTPFNSLYKR